MTCEPWIGRILSSWRRSVLRVRRGSLGPTLLSSRGRGVVPRRSAKRTPVLRPLRSGHQGPHGPGLGRHRMCSRRGWRRWRGPTVPAQDRRQARPVRRVVSRVVEPCRPRRGGGTRSPTNSPGGRRCQAPTSQPGTARRTRLGTLGRGRDRVGAAGHTGGDQPVVHRLGRNSELDRQSWDRLVVIDVCPSPAWPRPVCQPLEASPPAFHPPASPAAPAPLAPVRPQLSQGFGLTAATDLRLHLTPDHREIRRRPRSASHGVKVNAEPYATPPRWELLPTLTTEPGKRFRPGRMGAGLADNGWSQSSTAQS